jgi:hypothetical protein
VHESNAVFSTSLGERKKEALSLSAEEKRELAAFLQAQVTALAFLSRNSGEIQPRRADERPPDTPSPASGLLPVGEGVRRFLSAPIRNFRRRVSDRHVGLRRQCAGICVAWASWTDRTAQAVARAGPDGAAPASGRAVRVVDDAGRALLTGRDEGFEILFWVDHAARERRMVEVEWSRQG